MIIANKDFTFKNSDGFTSPAFSFDEYKVYVSVGSKVSPMGEFDITGIVLKKSEKTVDVTSIDEETQEEIVTPVVKTVYDGVNMFFNVPNTIKNTPDLDVITEASNVTKLLLEEWNPNIDFTIEL